MKKLFIGGQLWKIKLVGKRSKHLREAGKWCLNGRCDYQSCTIYILRDLDDQAREDTLLHELLHALLFVSGAEAAYNSDAKIDESIVSALTPMLHRLLKDLGFVFPQLA